MQKQTGNMPAEEALEKYFSALKLQPCKSEIIPAEESLDRITSAAVYAQFNSPHYKAAAMDGIAVKSSSTIGANESTPLVIDDFIPVNTGNPVNDPYDAVIMIENIILIDNGKRAKITEVAPVMQHIRPIGESFTAGEMLIPVKHKIRAIDIGVLFSAGVTCIEVYGKPKVAIFPTGSEIIEASSLQDGKTPKEGDVIESNTRMYEAQVKQAGAKASRFAPVPDDYEFLKNTILKASENFDMILINAGSSAGTEDFTVQVLREIGKVIVHGVAMKPGKPVILAIVNNKPVIGTPGYPVSAYISFETFVSPVLCLLTNRINQPRQKIKAVLSKKIISSADRREYVRVKLENTEGKLTASALARHSGALMSLVKADGFCIIEQGCGCIEAGETVTIELI